MKLIRLITNDGETQANFNNDFQDNLVLEPFSRISLLNLSLESINSVIEINATNNEINWRITSNEDYTTINIAEGSYSKLFIIKMLDDIQIKLNQSVIYVDGGDRNLIGIEWRSRIVDRYVNIEFKRGVLALHKDDYSLADDVLFDDDVGNYVNALGIWGEPTFSSDTVNDVAMGQTPISKGLGVYRAQIAILDPSGSNFNENGVIIGLSKTNLTNINPVDFDATDITYGIKASINSSSIKKYFTYTPDNRGIEQSVTPIYNGDFDPTNDYMEIQINGGRVVLGIYQNSETEFTEFLNEEYDQDDDLYPFICFHSGSDFTVVHNIQFTPSPYIASINHDKLFTKLIGIDPPQPNNPITNGESTIIFNSESVAEFLGYDNAQQGPYVFNEYNFIAQKFFTEASIAENFIVELQNLNIDSYDGLKQQRKNILYSLSKSNIDGSLHYEVPNLLYIDLLNRNSIILRNIKLRILEPDYTPIEILNKGYVTIIVDSGGNSSS